MRIAEATEDPIESKRRRILAIARAIIEKSGDFDLPMRKLAARAKVSLRTPYELFGSKNGIVGAILSEDQAAFRQVTAQLQSSDELENIFDRVRLGTDLYARNQPFYRALFLASQTYKTGHDEEPARESERSFRILCARARRAGLLREDIDPDRLGETLTDIFAANVRTWAHDAYDIGLLDLKIAFGFSITLAGAATPPVAERMRARALRSQGAIQKFGRSTRSKNHAPPPAARARTPQRNMA